MHQRQNVEITVSERIKESIDLIVSDICGPMQTQTAAGKRYAPTLIDDFSRYSEVFLLEEKSEALTIFKQYFEKTQNRFGTRIKAFRSDRGGEFTSKEFVDFLNANGITIQRTAPYTPQQNGIAERKNRTLMEMARCMMLDAKLEHRFWGEAVTMANWLQNMLPWKSVDRTPFEHWYGRIPFYGNLRRFGAKCFVRIHDELRTQKQTKHCRWDSMPNRRHTDAT